MFSTSIEISSSLKKMYLLRLPRVKMSSSLPCFVYIPVEELKIC